MVLNLLRWAVQSKSKAILQENVILFMVSVLHITTSRVEEVNPEYMMERSFHQFQNYSNIPQVTSNL